MIITGLNKKKKNKKLNTIMRKKNIENMFTLIRFSTRVVQHYRSVSEKVDRKNANLPRAVSFVHVQHRCCSFG